jgi:hypothetical protein
VTTGPATDVVETVATLAGTVDPNGAATSYRFEYGTDTSYGNSVPVPAGDAGSGSEPVEVAADVLGLQPDTTYHYRLVATGDGGTSSGEGRQFTTMAPDPPTPRGYELVSPADSRPYAVRYPWSGSGTVALASGARLSTADGTRMVFVLGSSGTLPGMTPDGDTADFIVASRQADGWDWAAPLEDRTGIGCSFFESPRFDSLTETGDALLIGALCANDKPRLSPRHPETGEPLDQTPADGAYTIYRGDVATNAATFISGKFGQDGPVVRDDSFGDEFLGGSPDLSTVYFVTSAGLLPGVPDQGEEYVYRYSEGETTLVTRTAAGAPFAISLGRLAPNPFSRANAVSADGSAVTLTAGGASTSNAAMVATDTNSVQDVYQARGDEVWLVTDPAEVPVGSGPPPQAAADRVFEGASADGSRVFFSTTERFTGDDTDSAGDIYVNDAAAGISRVSRQGAGGCTNCDDNASSSAPLTHSGARFVAASDDGARVFFVTGDVLSSADDDEQPSLYVRAVDGGTSYVAPAGAGVTSATNGDDAGTDTQGSLAQAGTRSAHSSSRAIALSPDGSVAAFSLATNVDLPAGRGGDDRDGARDLYVWRDGGGLRRVRQGVGPADNTASLPGLGCYLRNGTAATRPNKPRCRAMTADGRLVFFETTDSLVAEDADSGPAGDLTGSDERNADVYAVDTSDGSVELISPRGDTPKPSRYVDNSASGGDVFFETTETLDPSRDTDGGWNDLYTARTGAVFPPRLAPPEPCEPGAGCESPPTPAPGRSAPASGQAVEPDNARPTPRGRISIAPPGRKALSRAARTGVLRLRVRTARPGRLAVVARARVRLASGRVRMRTIASDRVRAGAPGTVSVRLTLSRLAQRHVRARRRLKLLVRVSAAGARPRHRAVVLRLPPRTRGRASALTPPTLVPAIQRAASSRRGRTLTR